MKNALVADVSALSTMKALVLPEGTPLAEAIDRFASNEGQHGIFLKGDDGRLSGVVNNADLIGLGAPPVRRHAGGSLARRQGAPVDLGHHHR